MGDLLGSPRVAPLFLGLTGYHSGLPLVVPMGWPPPSPSAPGDRQSSHPIVRYGPSKSRVWDFSPFSATWKFPSLGDDRRKRQAFWTVEAKLWVETPGGGDGSRRGSVRTCFMRR